MICSGFKNTWWLGSWLKETGQGKASQPEGEIGLIRTHRSRHQKWGGMWEHGNDQHLRVQCPQPAPTFLAIPFPRQDYFFDIHYFSKIGRYTVNWDVCAVHTEPLGALNPFQTQFLICQRDNVNVICFATGTLIISAVLPDFLVSRVLWSTCCSRVGSQGSFSAMLEPGDFTASLVLQWVSLPALHSDIIELCLFPHRERY